MSLQELGTKRDFINQLKFRVEWLGSDHNSSESIDQQLKLRNPYPQYEGIEDNLNKWLDDFSVRFIEDFHEQLELFVTGESEICNFDSDGIDIKNFYEMIKSIESYSDYTKVYNSLILLLRWHQLQNIDALSPKY